MKVRLDLRMVYAVLAVAASLASAPSGAAQSSAPAGSGQATPTPTLAAGAPLLGGQFLNPMNLPGDFAVMLQQKFGGRMTNAANASVSLAGTITDANGSRAAQITVQAPGVFRYQETGNGRTLTFNGSQFGTVNGQGGTGDQRIQESLLANFPDMLLFQLAASGARKIGPGFRADNGKTPNYTGPFWILYSFTPAKIAGLTAGGPLQQQLLVMIDQATGLMAEARTVTNPHTPTQQVTRTQFTNWFQQNGQWLPGQIVRLENGQQVLSFQVQQGSVGAQNPASTFEP
ncbi:MAG: hypothetical protein ABSG25_04255 [Bryobacteraceae bacterium]